ncbi:lytic transglycosylase domain-containing protein [Phreatobacter sp.]|uniref:lytic transglycosylase domain-containing protein n=1 Tax=Phreatobacter sp. TaxID=1966341 RepID=UPI0025DD034A|nr:lytic transglycosylase domain-containing protein [Phreatobacter sp.]
MFLFRSSAEPQSRPTSATEAGVSRVVSAIQAAAQKTGAGFDYLLRTARRESSLQPTAQASTSSARGLYQFIDSTWLTMVRDEGRNLGLGRFAEQIGRDASGRPTVADPTARQQILALRDDPAVAALMAGAFTNRNAADLRSATGRDPTEGELYMAHFLGSGGAARLINANQANPQASAALMFPDAAGANRRIFFDQGRPRTVAEVYQVLASGQSTAVAGAPPAATAAGQTTLAAATSAQEQASSWSAVPRINADPTRPFHSLFSGGNGPINAFVAATWTALGRDAASASRQVQLTTALTSPAAGNGPVGLPAGTARAALGGPFVPLQEQQPRRGQPLDLAGFLRPDVRR